MERRIFGIETEFGCLVHDPSAGASGKLVLQHANVVVPLAEAGAPVTAAPDAQAAPKP